MGILIGMDEAGYGPHLGPLVIAATAWHVGENDWSSDWDGECKQTKRRAAENADSSVAVAAPPRRVRKKTVAKDRVDLYRLLQGVLAKSPSERRIAIADSKLLYTPGGGYRQLERGLHCVLRSMRQTLSCWSEMVTYCGADPDSHHKRTCWPEDFNCSLPVDATSDELVRLEARFGRACEAASVRPLLIRARLVFPEQFNDLIAHYGNKAAALSRVTIGLLREIADAAAAQCSVLESLAPSPQPPAHIYAVCDKHGGRNFYTSLLQHHFSEHWIAPVFESHLESHYEWGEADSRTRVVFRVNGETFLPTALASMTAKYLRELSMRAFNEFWRTHLPELKPTAGYYRDAWRFKKEIAGKQRELGIDDHVLWRDR
jgi:hypothetical protein